MVSGTLAAVNHHFIKRITYQEGPHARCVHNMQGTPKLCAAFVMCASVPVQVGSLLCPLLAVYQQYYGQSIIDTLILLLVSYIISLSPLVIQGGSRVRCERTSSYIRRPTELRCNGAPLTPGSCTSTNTI